jgi:predicted ATPase
MVNIASQNCQVIIATQSTTLIDEFEAEDIIVVERKNNRSIFKKLNISEMKDWLQEYSLSEIWEKNIIGGRP